MVVIDATIVWTALLDIQRGNGDARRAGHAHRDTA